MDLFTACMLLLASSVLLLGIVIADCLIKSDDKDE